MAGLTPILNREQAMAYQASCAPQSFVYQRISSVLSLYHSGIYEVGELKINAQVCLLRGGGFLDGLLKALEKSAESASVQSGVQKAAGTYFGLLTGKKPSGSAQEDSKALQELGAKLDRVEHEQKEDFKKLLEKIDRLFDEVLTESKEKAAKRRLDDIQDILDEDIKKYEALQKRLGEMAVPTVVQQTQGAVTNSKNSIGVFQGNIGGNFHQGDSHRG